MAVMMPSPTRAMIVSSVAPPINCSMFVRTVTRARTFNSTPFLAIALSVVRLQSFRVGAVDHLRIDAGLHGVEHVAAGQVDGRGPVEIQVDVGAMGGNNRLDHVRHAAAGQIVGLEPPGADAGLFFRADARLHRHDLAQNNDVLIDVSKAHADQAQQADIGAGHVRPKPDFPVIVENDDDDQG